jgi:AcrR family transcriptional regulator
MEAEMSLKRAEKSAPLRVPIEDPSSSLPATAQRILAAARTLLVERGYDAVTLEKVAAEAGVNKASIRYNFGNKAGLVAALVDFMLHEEFEQGVSALPSTPHDDLVRALIDGKRHIIQTTDNFRGFFDMLPYAMRDEDLRRRMASSYPWWAEQNLRLLRVEGAGPARRPEVLRGLGRLLSAVADGLSVQAGLDPDGLDMDEPLKALEFLLDRALPDLERLAAEADQS